MLRDNERWKNALLATGDVRVCFCSMTDEDVPVLLEATCKSEAVTEMDLSHNSISDVGIQTIVTCLASPENFPKLKRLSLYANKFSSLGETMVTQGLTIFRPNLKVNIEAPSYALP